MMIQDADLGADKGVNEFDLFLFLCIIADQVMSFKNDIVSLWCFED